MKVALLERPEEDGHLFFLRSSDLRNTRVSTEVAVAVKKRRVSPAIENYVSLLRWADVIFACNPLILIDQN
ncbi:hypothetical protein [Chitiniphilus shinanonensis]|uniref:hypothetical protein n=1 Tax=Chitiniphilus shinanonensis TaxID=553088 RepID=UPI0012F97528|nr:hypothetical protein [Chitiniphilus shinanonensis]